MAQEEEEEEDDVEVEVEEDDIPDGDEEEPVSVPDRGEVCSVRVLCRYWYQTEKRSVFD